jgi:hypothetical protein
MTVDGVDVLSRIKGIIGGGGGGRDAGRVIRSTSSRNDAVCL